MAALGMINNVNEYGFSFSDYLDFSGGVKTMMGGGGSARIRSNGAPARSSHLRASALTQRT